MTNTFEFKNMNDGQVDSIILAIVRQACVDYVDYVCALNKSTFLEDVHMYFYGTSDVDLRDSDHLVELYRKICDEIEIFDKNRYWVICHRNRKNLDDRKWMQNYTDSVKKARWYMTRVRSDLEHIVEVIDFFRNEYHCEAINIDSDFLLDSLARHCHKKKYDKRELMIWNGYEDTERSLEMRRKNLEKTNRRKQKRDPITKRFI